MAAVTCILVLAANAAVSAGELAKVPLSPHNSTHAGPLFTRLPVEMTGITLVHRFPPQGAFELLQDQGAGAGVCVGDFDGDGRPDLCFSRYDQGIALYRNLGNWKFEEIGERAGLRNAGRWCYGITAADVDNDGDLDLFVAVFDGPNLLFQNRGDGTFDERGDSLGVAFSGASVAMAFDDFDHDGLLDGALVTHRLAGGPEARLPRSSKDSFSRGVIQVGPDKRLSVNPTFTELFEIMSKGGGRSELIIAGQRDKLYRGTGQGRFQDATQAAGLVGTDIGLANHWWDYNGDGWPDLYISNDYKGSDRLFENQRNGIFREVAAAALPCVPWSSMGSDSADLNNDGLIDFIATDMSGTSHARRMLIHVDEKESWFLKLAHPHQYPRNAVFLATGTPRLLEVAYLLGLARTDWTWSPKFGDFDNDGRVDLFIANGMARDFVNADEMQSMRDRGNRNWLKTPLLRERNLAFRNLGDLRFGPATDAWGLGDASASYGAVSADLDRDGDLDLVVMSLDESPLVYRNDSPGGNRLLVRLKGTRSNSWGVGAMVRLNTRNGPQVRRMTLASGFMSANEPILHFGLGDQTSIDSLTVDWPNGQRQVFGDVEANQLVTLTEPTEPRPGATSTEAARSPLFRETGRLSSAVHHEQEFDDFAREAWLPWQLSRLGPGLAVGDINGDGKEDAVLAGAAGSATTLWLQQPDHQFSELPCAALQADEGAEDMGVLLFDLDGDQDLDLFVVSGGVESAAGDEQLTDRLYLNDGRGQFVRAPESVLPRDTDSGSVVVAADFDRDGDLDLFIGGRTVPGQYPKPGRNRLLKNERGQLVDETERLAPGLRSTGMVTGALWTDVNGDGDIDLAVTHEWGPVKLFLNRGGRFTERPLSPGGPLLTGWWTGICGGDFDRDGDIDLAVGNLGLNSPYQASVAEPVVAWSGDFEGDGSRPFVEGYYENHQLYPRRRLETWRSFLPSLVTHYSNHTAFGGATLPEILGNDRIKQAARWEMNTLETGVFWNDGQGNLKFAALPRLAQAAPVFGITTTDLDADGTLDLVMVQNFSSPQLDIGALNGGMGVVLQGNGRGEFRELWPAASGFSVPGDGRALAVVDFDGSGVPGLLAAQNAGGLLSFANLAPRTNSFLRVRLQGEAGNPRGVGSRVTLVGKEGSRLTQEIYAGSGYLTQSSPDLYFGVPSKAEPHQLEIRWPQGRTDRITVPPDSRLITVRWADAR